MGRKDLLEQNRKQAETISDYQTVFQLILSEYYADEHERPAEIVELSTEALKIKTRLHEAHQLKRSTETLYWTARKELADLIGHSRTDIPKDTIEMLSRIPSLVTKIAEAKPAKMPEQNDTRVESELERKLDLKVKDYYELLERGLSRMHEPKFTESTDIFDKSTQTYIDLGTDLKNYDDEKATPKIKQIAEHYKKIPVNVRVMTNKHISELDNTDPTLLDKLALYKNLYEKLNQVDMKIEFAPIAKKAEEFLDEQVKTISSNKRGFVPPKKEWDRFNDLANKTKEQIDAYESTLSYKFDKQRGHLDEYFAYLKANNPIQEIVDRQDNQIIR